MSDRRMIHTARSSLAMPDTDEASKGGRSSVLVFGVVAAAMTVMLILVGVSGRHVASNPQQANIESPTTSGWQNPY
jgi:hypothetical protein